MTTPTTPRPPSKVKPPTAFELELIERVRAGLQDGHVEIRVLCPNGHYVAHAGIALDKDLGGNLPLIMRARGPGKQFDDALSHDGMVFDGIHSQNVWLECRNRRCTYRGRSHSVKLALHLADAALDGQTEYRLTT